MLNILKTRNNNKKKKLNFFNCNFEQLFFPITYEAPLVMFYYGMFPSFETQLYVRDLYVFSSKIMSITP